MAIFTNASLVLQLQALVTVVFDGVCDCRLYQNFVAVDGSTTLGELIEADFGGYAAVSPATWDPASLFANQLARAKQTVVTFTCDGVPPANFIYGAYFAAGGDLLAVMPFAAGPLLVDTAGQIVTVEMPLFFGPQVAL